MLSRRLCTLISLFALPAMAQQDPATPPPLVQAPLHQIGENRTLPATQIAIEERVSRATLKVRFHSPEDPPEFEENATAFQIAPDLVMTNRHVIERLTGAGRLKNEQGLAIAEQRLRSLELASESQHLLFRAEKIAYCSMNLDFCILRLASLPDGRNAGTLLETLKPYRSLETLTVQKNPIIGIMGNMNGEGIRVSSDRLIKIQPQGLLLHCVPTTSHESGGNSGSPIFDASGNILGIDAYSLNLDSGCKHRPGTTGGGISSEAFLKDLIENRPELSLEIHPL